jgi:hypothetical protein
MSGRKVPVIKGGERVKIHLSWASLRLASAKLGSYKGHRDRRSGTRCTWERPRRPSSSLHAQILNAHRAL